MKQINLDALQRKLKHFKKNIFNLRWNVVIESDNAIDEDENTDYRGRQKPSCVQT